jgi:hypothetical protein
MKKQNYDIALDISEGELRHLIVLHAERIRNSTWNIGEQESLQETADRMSTLLEILKRKRHE